MVDKCSPERLSDFANEIAKIQAHYPDVIKAEKEARDGLQKAKDAVIQRYREVIGSEPPSLHPLS